MVIKHNKVNTYLERGVTVPVILPGVCVGLIECQLTLGTNRCMIMLKREQTNDGQTLFDAYNNVHSDTE